MHIREVLNDSKKSFLVTFPGKTKEVVIGVPHHAPLNKTTLPCKDHPDSDENAGFIGYHISRLLNCYCIIASNYFIDSNKDMKSDYCKMIESLSPKILIEIHGHGGSKAKFDIEISSGSSEKSNFSKELAERLRKRITHIPELKKYTLSGDYNEIYFQASSSVTITTNAWVAFHIELPKLIRQSSEVYTIFCELLCEIIRDLRNNFNDILKVSLESE